MRSVGNNAFKLSLIVIFGLAQTLAQNPLTPVSVDAITSEQIDSQGLRGIDDITRLAPGVTFTRTGMTATGNFNDEGSDIAIRGIESTAGTSTLSASLPSSG